MKWNEWRSFLNSTRSNHYTWENSEEHTKYSGTPCEDQAGKKIQNTAKVTRDTVPPQKPTIKISIQLLVQIEFQK